MKKKFAWLLLLLTGIAPSLLHADPYSFGFNMNFPMAVEDTSDVLKDGLGFGMDFGYRNEDSPLGIRLDMIYANWNLTSDVLNQIRQADSGYATTWGFGLSAVLTPPHADKVKPYIHAGPGFYYEHAEASRFTGGGGYYCDPWFGCYNMSTSQDVADFSTWRLGWMGGAGLDIAVSQSGNFFMQMQYHLINNANADTEFVPIAFGFRQQF